MRHAVAALGLCSWDRFLVTDRYPGAGEYAIVRERLEQPGGTTGNTCDALARLGIEVMLVSTVGDDPEGQALIDSLARSRCDIAGVERRPGESTDSSVIVVSGCPAHRERTIYWIQGARPKAGDALPIDDMLEHEWVLIDVDDPHLRGFMLDLPAHRSPRTKLFGTMTYLLEMPADLAWQQALRHDAMVGNERELLALTGASSLDAAVEHVRRDLRFNACRAIFISRGRSGAIAIRPDGVESAAAFEVDVMDTTGAGDAFAAGCLWGLLDRLADKEILRRANALGGLACRALGARAALPNRDEVEALLLEGVTVD